MDHKVNKLENSARLAELDPKGTLTKAGLKDGMSLCDIGAGSGIFTFPAAKISKGAIYALEVSDDMIEILKKRAEEKRLSNVIVKKVESETLPLEDGICDMAIMVTVLHEIEDQETMLREIKRVLKEKGRLVIIEFHEKGTPIGPPEGHRLSQKEAEKLCKTGGYQTEECFSLGENFYCLILRAV